MHADPVRPSSISGRHLIRSFRWILIGLLLVVAPAFAGTPRWMLVYYRQVGNLVNGGRHTIESHLFREDGSKGYNVGLTNRSNSGFAIFGTADADGWVRITTQEPVFAYDLMVYRPNVLTDHSPNFYHHNPANGAFYSFVTHWLYVEDDSRVNAYPRTPVYHYDQVNGLNDSQLNEPPGANSDGYGLTQWSDYQAQTFVVPPGINRIISAQAFVIRNYLTHFQYRATIHLGSPTGPQVGPAALSRCAVSVEFFPVLVNWPIDAVQVTAGQTYALKLTPVLNVGCADEINNPGTNAYATLTDNYPEGMLYSGATPVPGRDLLAIIAGIGHDNAPLDPPVISTNPSSFTRQTAYKQNVSPSDSFTLTNSGGAPLDFEVGGVPGWLSVNPIDGRIEPGASLPFSVGYATASLTAGIHAADLTITDPVAANSPYILPVRVTVMAPDFATVDFDRDGDVDQEDFGAFQACYTGQGNAQTAPACAGARLDGDNDVDAADFDIFFLRCFTGPGGQANPLCNE